MDMGVRQVGLPDVLVLGERGDRYSGEIGWVNRRSGRR
jgi:hypothetical protein